MIHYHGSPIWPSETAVKFYARRHAFVSFARPEQISVIADVSQSFALDNGAFSAWKRGQQVNWRHYYSWVDQWRQHPGFDFAVIPDVIDGDEAANDQLLKEWPWAGYVTVGVPVWHLHESLERLVNLAGSYPRIALGSSGRWSTPGTPTWWQRMSKAMESVCLTDQPICKLHGLRMLRPEIFSRLPLASADSTMAVRNVRDSRWRGSVYANSPLLQALVVAERVEAINSAPHWDGMPPQDEFALEVQACS